MNLKSKLLFIPLFSLLTTTPIFSMDEENNTDGISAKILQQPDARKARAQFVKSFLPQNSTNAYVKKVADCYRGALGYKKEIIHDGRPQLFGQSAIPQNTVTTDYEWQFPPVPRVQRHLLEFCAKSKNPVNMMDIGAGYGIDSLFALLTKNIKNLYALEKQKAQADLLKHVVTGSIHTHVSSEFPLQHFKAFHKDFLTLAPDFSKGAFDVLNANKVVHFFDIDQTKIFAERSSSLLKKGGRLFLTCLTPTPGSEIEAFMNSQIEREFPGYVFYKQETRLIGMNIPGESHMLEVRTPTPHEQSAHFYQSISRDHVITDRVMHYHTSETLQSLLGDNFDVIKTMITTPKENNGTDHMISIVAEKK